jgi:hypothetical protein
MADDDKPGRAPRSLMRAFHREDDLLRITQVHQLCAWNTHVRVIAEMLPMVPDVTIKKIRQNVLGAEAKPTGVPPSSLGPILVDIGKHLASTQFAIMLRQRLDGARPKRLDPGVFIDVYSSLILGSANMEPAINPNEAWVLVARNWLDGGFRIDTCRTCRTPYLVSTTVITVRAYDVTGDCPLCRAFLAGEYSVPLRVTPRGQKRAQQAIASILSPAAGSGED